MKNLEYLNSLNKEQKEAVSYINGPLLIVAGAGSGKTRVLTSKIAFIIIKLLISWKIDDLQFIFRSFFFKVIISQNSFTYFKLAVPVIPGRSFNIFLSSPFKLSA